MLLTINGEDRTIENAANVEELLGQLGIAATKVAVERNLEIVPKTAYGQTALADGDKLEIVHFIGGGSGEADLAAADDDGFVVAGKKFSSRLLHRLVGIGQIDATHSNSDDFGPGCLDRDFGFLEILVFAGADQGRG